MHNYSIGNRYTTKTKIGNWYEEMEKYDYDFKEYLYRKDNRMNLTLNTQSKLSFSNQPQQLSTTDGLVRYADRFILGNQKIHTVLAFNINQSLLGEQCYAVTTSPHLQPSLRNVFQFQPLHQTNQSTVKYGDKLRIVTYAGQRKLYLQSIAVSPMRSSKFSRFQEVSVTADLNSNTIWAIDHINPKNRFYSGEEEVKVFEEILVRHVPTAQWLGTHEVSYVNDFGGEYEVFAKSMLTNNKTQNLFGQKSGHISAENVLRSQALENSWRLIVKK